jgi:hypothetical protein
MASFHPLPCLLNGKVSLAHSFFSASMRHGTDITLTDITLTDITVSV